MNVSELRRRASAQLLPLALALVALTLNFAIVGSTASGQVETVPIGPVLTPAPEDPIYQPDPTPNDPIYIGDDEDDWEIPDGGTFTPDTEQEEEECLFWCRKTCPRGHYADNWGNITYVSKHKCPRNKRCTLVFNYDGDGTLTSAAWECR